MTKSRRKWHAETKACANIALAKYWGKADIPLNLPAVPSISMTLDGLVTETRIRVDETLDADRVELDGREATASESKRVIALLDDIRRRAKRREFAHVVSRNRFPTAAGLASSASGFAALASAADHAYELGASDRVLSAIARQASASAARSIYGGFVELPAGKPGQKSLAAKPLFDADHWDLRIVVAQTAKGPKKVGSTEGMERSRETSPFYDAWVAKAPAITKRIRQALRKRDLDTLGAAMEQSTMAFHACAMTAEPSIFAIGDVIGSALAHTASHEGTTAAKVIAGHKTAFEPNAIPSVVYTDPEIAWCGLTESEAERQDIAFEVARFPWAASGRATTMPPPRPPRDHRVTTACLAMPTSLPPN